MRSIVGSAAFALFLIASGPCNAQTVVKQEPFEGNMSPGSIILVDDGTCGKGKIKQVTGGELGAINPRPRTRKCIPRDNSAEARCGFALKLIEYIVAGSKGRLWRAHPLLWE